MRKLLTVLLLLISLLSFAQDEKPTDSANFKYLQSPFFFYNLPDSSVWISKNQRYGWTKLDNARDPWYIKMLMGIDTVILPIHKKDTLNLPVYKLKGDSIQLSGYITHWSLKQKIDSIMGLLYTRHVLDSLFNTKQDTLHNPVVQADSTFRYITPYQFTGKVDKIAGKHLPDNNFTDADSVKVSNLSGVNSGDNAVNSNYSGLAMSKENTITAGTTDQYWRGDKSWQAFPSIPTQYTDAMADARVVMGITGKQNSITTGTTAQYFRGDLSLATFPSIPTQYTDAMADARVVAGITGKQNTIAAGTTAQYWRGDKTWQAFPTIPTQYTDAMADARVVAGITGKENSISAGTTAQYWRGDKSWQTLPTGPSLSVQILSGTTVSWNCTNGVNATLTLSGTTTVTLSNVTAGTCGNIKVTNPATAHPLTFALSGKSISISPTIYVSSGRVLTSGLSKLDVFSWYYDGTNLIINGTNDYK